MLPLLLIWIEQSVQRGLHLRLYIVLNVFKEVAAARFSLLEGRLLATRAVGCGRREGEPIIVLTGLLLIVLRHSKVDRAYKLEIKI